MTNRIEKRIETVASEVVGAVKATRAKFAGLTGVFEHLAREHGKVTGLLLRLKARIGAPAKSGGKAPRKDRTPNAMTARPLPSAHRVARKTTAKAGRAKTAKRTGGKTGKSKVARGKSTAGR